MQVHSGKYFTFANDSNDLTSSLAQVLAYIESNLFGLPQKNDLYFKTQSIVTELLTNGFKHAGAESVNISVEFDPEYITIVKTDHGVPFPLALQSGMGGAKTKLSFDILHNLYAVNEKPNQLRFIVEDITDDNPDIFGLGEHFGLLIITKCAEEFIYEFDETTGLNTFTARVQLYPPAP